ncbi:MAG: ABC transporter ATP-binding protein [Tistlia sp.]|uniref:ABC transporter ATP-binding protein n=1 Tax=Tistlia sp. TaxID=3057121 RepID=UPI0034A3F502
MSAPAPGVAPATGSAPDAPEVRVEQAHLAFDGVLLFDQLSLTLPAGRTSCLLGPSGVGKSSLVRLIAGLAHGAEGRVLDGAGRDLAGRVAYMAQRDLLLPWLSVLDNVLLGDRLRGHPPRRERARALLEAVGLAERADALPAALSGGMRQRTALARTLMEDKPVVLMDEPFSALDAITRFELQETAAGLLAGRTVLLITHDPLEALRLGHEIRVLAGRPALLGAAIEPAGLPPRDPATPGLLELQVELLRRLTAARAA